MARRRRTISASSIVQRVLRLCLFEAIIQGISGASHGADRILLAGGIEQFSQPSDMNIDRALVDVDVAAPDVVEQLLAAEYAAGVLQEEFQQAILGRSEVDRPARTRDAALFTIEFDVAVDKLGRQT